MVGLILKMSLRFVSVEFVHGFGEFFCGDVSECERYRRFSIFSYDLGFFRDPLRCLASDGDVEVVEGVCYLIWLGVRLSLEVDNCWGCPVSSFLRHDCAEDPHSLFRVSLIC